MATPVGFQRLAMAALLGVGLTSTVVGCGAAPSEVSSSGSASASAFEVVARYPAKALGLRRPNALALGPDGDLYVTDYRQRVSVISPQGRVLRRWGELGDGPGQFHFVGPDPSDPTWIAGRLTVSRDGEVYVSDSGNARVQVFTPDGGFVRQFGSYGEGDGQFHRPYDLAVDASGDVFVADDERQMLSGYSATGQTLWTIGGTEKDADLVGHFHVGMIDGHGRLLVTNDDQARILYIDAEGHKVDVFGGGEPLVQDGPCDVTVDDLGYTYVSPCGPGSTYVFDRGHQLVASWPASEGVLVTAPRFGPDGTGYALGIDGSVVVVRATLGRS
ncbi:MAG: NHL repeat-containing protein [Nocardioides sp.]|uniref:NHL repeat-containing protein n=1 Tax=Nocardioides sp. TaxID=35761 RepID=UPI0032657F1D